jgi:hypothetical protein
MPVSFEQVLEYLVKDKLLQENSKPRVLIPAKGNSFNLPDPLGINRQLVIVVQGMRRGDSILYNNIEYNIRRELGLENRIGSFQFDSREEVNSILQQLGSYFKEPIDPNAIIREYRGERTDDIVFVLFLPVVESYYY